MNVLIALGLVALGCKVCQECGEVFHSARSNRKFCGKRCGGRVRSRRFYYTHKIENGVNHG